MTVIRARYIVENNPVNLQTDWHRISIVAFVRCTPLRLRAFTSTDFHILPLPLSHQCFYLKVMYQLK